MSEQVGWRGFLKSLRMEAPNYAAILPQLPRLLHQRLTEIRADQMEKLLTELARQQRQRNFWLMIIAVTGLGAVATLLYAHL